MEDGISFSRLPVLPRHSNGSSGLLRFRVIHAKFPTNELCRRLPNEHGQVRRTQRRRKERMNATLNKVDK